MTKASDVARWSLPDLGMAGRRHAFDVEDVLRGVGHAVHRPAPLALGDLGFGGLRLRQRLVGGDGDEGVVVRVDRRDPVEQRLGPFHRRELFRAQQLRAFGNGEPGEVGHLLLLECGGVEHRRGRGGRHVALRRIADRPRPRSAAAFTPSGNSFSAFASRAARPEAVARAFAVSLTLSPVFRGGAKRRTRNPVQIPYLSGFRVRAIRRAGMT